MENDRLEFRNKFSKARKRRWTAKEELLIIQYLKENITTFEQPTGQVYYEKFLKQSKLGVGWSLVKNKVRHLRLKYINARKLIKNSKPEDINWENVRKICPYYKRMDEVFVGWDGTTKEIKLDLDMFTDSTSSFPNYNESNFSTDESKDTKPHIVYESPSHSNVDVDLTEVMDNGMATEEAQFEEVLLSPTPTAAEAITTGVNAPPITSTQIKQVKTIHNIHTDALDMDDSHDLQHNIPEVGDWEVEKFLKSHKLKCDTLDFEKEKFLFEREKFSKEFELRVREMQWKCEMGHAEMEMKERISMRELEIKEKVALKELQQLNTQYGAREM